MIDRDGQAESLLNTDDDLSPEQMQLLKALGERSWQNLNRHLRRRAEMAYSVVRPDDFATCVREHLDEEQQKAMVEAETYSCPSCGRLLKDRRTPVASAVLLERARLAGLWLAVEEATTDEHHTMAVRQMRKALGL